MSTDVPVPALCRCGELLEAATPVHGPDDQQVTEGALHVCINCTAVAKFDRTGRPVPLTDLDLVHLPFEVRLEIQRVRVVIKEFHRSRRRS